MPESNLNIVYFIMAHKNPSQLNRLLQALNAPCVIFLIHVDNKSEEADFKKIVQFKNVFFINSRVNVYWGGFSQVQATINGLRYASDKIKKYDYFVFLTGQDYPVKSNSYIFDFFKTNYGKEFLDFYYLKNANDKGEGLSRINRRYYMDRHEDFFRKAVNKLYSFLPKRKLLCETEFARGSAYFAFTKQAVDYVLCFLNENKSFTSFFKQAFCPDEVFFQTLILNSPFKNKVNCGNLHFIKWKEGQASPQTLNTDNINELKKTEKLFARKFDEAVDAVVFDHIDKELRNA